MRHRAWDSREQATSGEEARQRFGDEFVDAVKSWKNNWDSPNSSLHRYYEERSEPAPALYRGVRFDQPLQVGDTYETIGLDSWTEGREVAEDFAFTFGDWSDDSYPTILRLNEGESALSIDRWDDWGGEDEIRQEGEWLLSGDFEVTGREDITNISGTPIGSFVDVRRRRAWNDPKPVDSIDEARTRFGDEFVDMVRSHKHDSSHPARSSERMRQFYDERKQKTPSLYRGLVDGIGLEVGKTYQSEALESWTESQDVAADTAVYRRNDIATDEYPWPAAVLHLDEGDEGLYIDRVPSEHASEAEWLVGGSFDVIEEMEPTAGDVRNFKVRRRAWKSQPANTGAPPSDSWWNFGGVEPTAGAWYKNDTFDWLPGGYEHNDPELGGDEGVMDRLQNGYARVRVWDKGDYDSRRVSVEGGISKSRLTDLVFDLYSAGTIDRNDSVIYSNYYGSGNSAISDIDTTVSDLLELGQYGRVANAERDRLYDSGRKSPSERGYDRRWRNFSEQYRANNPLCQGGGCESDAQVVHHINGWTTDEERLDESGVVGLCHPCHNREHKSGVPVGSQHYMQRQWRPEGSTQIPSLGEYGKVAWDLRQPRRSSW